MSVAIVMAIGPELPGLFVSAIDLGVARAHERLGREAPLVERAMGAPLLVLDDLGAEQLTALSAVGDVIHKRHAGMMPTIISTGFAEQGIAARYGDGIARRVFEGAVVIRVGASRGAR